MIRSTRFLTIAIALVLAAPTGLATWKAYGGFEPDSAYDDDKYMWFGEPEYDVAAGATEKRIYFNAYPTVYASANPNVGALESQYVLPAVNFYAMLGVWVDCNDDGYVGHLESALDEYRNELLTDKTRCPPGSDHNKDNWVTELRTIGRTAFTSDKRVIKDMDAMVWGDIGRPYPVGPEDGPNEGGSCALTPFPKGTMQSTGGFLNYADCRDGYLIASTYNDVATALGLSQLPPLEDERNWAEEGHPLHQPTFGSEDSANNMVHAQDCSQAPLVDLGQVNEEFEGAGPRPLPPGGPGVNPNGNAPGTYNATNEAVFDDCDTSNDRGEDFYSLLNEAEFNGVSAWDKREADMNFNFSIMSRGGLPLGFPTMGPSDGGVTAFGNALGAVSNWESNQVTTTSHIRLVRADLSPEPANFWTFYAFVGAEAQKAGSTPGQTAEYGAPFCPDGYGETGGLHYGWNCEASLWNRNSDGTLKHQGFTLALPGAPYNLRDTDCYDGTLTSGVPVGISTAAYSDTTCDTPAV